MFIHIYIPAFIHAYVQTCKCTSQQPVYVSIYLPTYLPIYLSVSLSVHLLACMDAHSVGTMWCESALQYEGIETKRAAPSSITSKRLLLHPLLVPALPGGRRNLNPVASEQAGECALPRWQFGVPYGLTFIIV